MTTRELRNRIISGLAAYLGQPVRLADQAVPESECPYMFYQPIAPYLPGASDIVRERVPGVGDHPHDIMSTRREQAQATFSFSACSHNRETPDGYRFGDDEAQDLAERAQGWFLHVGKPALALDGIVVLEVHNVTNRTAIEVDEVERRYGFDVRLRYLRVDQRRDNTVEAATIAPESH